MKKQTEVNVIVATAKTFATAYHKAVDMSLAVSQILCDAFHKGILNHDTLNGFGVEVGKQMDKSKLSFPMLALICMQSMLEKSDARAFLNGVSEGSDKGTASAISQALSGAGYEMGKQSGRPETDPVEKLVKSVSKSMEGMSASQKRAAKKALLALLA
jgi:hypothetical protein